MWGKCVHKQCANIHIQAQKRWACSLQTSLMLSFIPFRFVSFRNVTLRYESKVLINWEAHNYYSLFYALHTIPATDTLYVYGFIYGQFICVLLRYMYVWHVILAAKQKMKLIELWLISIDMKIMNWKIVFWSHIFQPTSQPNERTNCKILIWNLLT